MSRVKISEFAAKRIISDHLKLSYGGFPFELGRDTEEKIEKSLKSEKSYVVKVDQAVKKRFKQGLVLLDVKRPDKISKAISEWSKQGFSNFLIEEYVPHDPENEKYLALERTSKGILVHYFGRGGIDIEEHEKEIKHEIVKDPDDVRKISMELELSPELLEKLVDAFEINYFSFLEINPLVISFKKPYFLDIAAEVDSAAEFFVDTWSSEDIRSAAFQKTEEEKNIEKLSEKSSSSLSMTVLNPNGSIFMLLSGGGVSVLLADEVQSLGLGKELANYGEYSGNPTEEETFLYTKNLLSLLFKSKAQKKALIIGGGVANFTDVRITFRGVVRALSEVLEKLKEQNVGIYVRRGGPHQEEGLALMSTFLSKNGIQGEVNGPQMAVSEIVARAVKGLKI